MDASVTGQKTVAGETFSYLACLSMSPGFGIMKIPSPKGPIIGEGFSMIGTFFKTLFRLAYSS